MQVNVDPAEIQSIVSMSASVPRLAKLACDPEVDLAEICRVIEYDQVITAQVLHWANSAWSASQSQILTVKDAVVRCGVGQVVKLVMGHCLAKPLKNTVPGYDLLENELWQHSVAAALAAECLEKIVHKNLPAPAFTVALMHDIGKLLLERHLGPEVMEEMRHQITERGISYIEAEREMLGTDHAVLGGAIARYWQFPETLVAGIEQHHTEIHVPDPLLDSVQVANAVAKLIGVGLGSEQMNLTIHPGVPRRLGLTSSGMESLCALVQSRLAETLSQWEA
ncbi:MAG: HDOD domain-containing protein [Candidatus Firestonebacteria bacterium]|nr:HDOD domain-containing protein [Candidatus Firestonebacteria bacterium]